MANPVNQRRISDLTTWFLNAKRSLTSVTFCTRGNEIIGMARGALMGASVVSSRAYFLRSGIQYEMRLLWQAKLLMDNQQENAKKEFQTSLQHLDDANRRLDQVLASLRTTIVQPAFSTAEASDGSQHRMLYDFVDEVGIENLRSQLKTVIDNVQETDEMFANHSYRFTTDLTDISKTYESLLTSTGSTMQHPASVIIPSLQTLEDHASIMASLLESLARHYDLCSLALKEAESPDPASNVPIQETADDKASMLQVLEKDATEVDDVVAEIKERLEDMEAVGGNVELVAEEIETNYQALLQLLFMLTECQGVLSNCTTQSRAFLQSQRENQETIVERLDELDRLTQHYLLFTEAYDALLIEVGRRISVQKEKDAIVQDALSKIDVVNEADLNEREVFRQEYGDYLPSDIWPGLSDPPGAYAVEPIDAWDIPDIEPGVIEEAITRRAVAGSKGA